ncbi:OmpW/AlkL family protein [Parvibaculum sedimenti]|nr:OmpW family outer membrane protein [Parvibaculum sedimenti]
MQGNKTSKIVVMALGALLGTTALSAPVLAADAFQGKSAGDFLVRARGIYVIPDEKLDGISGLSISNEVVPEVDFSYFVTDNIAFELIAATTRHEVSIPSASLGKVSLLPPTLTVQYHFMPKAQFSPYVGAGLNYTFFYNVDSGDFSSVKYDNHVGYALQAGVDYALGGNWSLNADVKKIFLKTDAHVSGVGTVGTTIDPWIVGLGVGYRF